MASRIIMAAVLLIIPLTMMGFGALLKKFPPPVNGVFGYRTKRSLRDPESWILAQSLIAGTWTKWGLVTLIVTLAAVSYILVADTDTASTVTVVLVYAQMVPLVGAIIPVERALKEYQEGSE